MEAAAGGEAAWWVASAVGALLLLVLSLLWLRKDDDKLPPGTWGWPVVGETFRRINVWPGAPDLGPLPFDRERAAKYGDVYRTSLLGDKIVNFLSPEGNKFVLSNTQQVLKNVLPYTAQTLLGPNTLSTTDGEFHRKTKKFLMAFFNAEALKSCVPLMEECTFRTLKRWGEQGHVKVYKEMKRFTFEIIAQVMVGMLPGPAMEALSRNFNVWANGLFFTLPLNLPFTAYGRAMQARKEIMQQLSEAVKQKRANLHKSGSGDVLSRILTADESGVSLDDEALLENLLTIFFAGHDTSSSTLTNFMLLVSQHSDVMNKLRDEHMKLAASKPGQKLDWDDIKSMEYTDRVISEVLRVLPPAPQMFREATQDFEYNGYRIKKGWKVVYNVVHPANNEEYFPDPDCFNPDRFEKPVKPGAFIPFGGGPHMCLGYEFARVEMKVFIHHLMLTYRWNLQHTENPLVYLPIPHPKNSLPIEVVPLQKAT